MPKKQAATDVVHKFAATKKQHVQTHFTSKSGIFLDPVFLKDYNPKSDIIRTLNL